MFAKPKVTRVFWSITLHTGLKNVALRGLFGMITSNKRNLFIILTIRVVNGVNQKTSTMGWVVDSFSRKVPRLKIGQQCVFSEYCWMEKIADNYYRGNVINCAGGLVSSRHHTPKGCVSWICEMNKSIEEMGRIF